MATYTFSALADGQAISFDVDADDLVFDQAAIAAADLRFSVEGPDTRVSVVSGASAGKDVLLLGVAPQQLAQANVQFADGSVIRFGDNAVALNDDAANSLVGTAGRDLLLGFGGNDFMQGGDGADVLNGGAGNDTMSGNNGVDRVDGGAGNDTVAGGSGQDAFAFSAFGAANADSVSDFASGWDRMVLDAGSFTQAGAAGRLAAGDDRFHAAPGASGGADAEDRFVYNTTTRQLFYDPDGSGAQAAQLIATLQPGASLAATDLWVEAATTPPAGGPLNGTPGDDSITGTQGNDNINGFAGNDTLDGSGGSDRLDGGAGNDRLVGGRFDFELPDGADTLLGGDGDDFLDGHSARVFESDPVAETLDGGLGNDTYVVDNEGDVLLDAGGTDTVMAHNIDWTLGPAFENLMLRNENDSSTIGIGNELDNVLGAPNSGWYAHYEGRGGNDTIWGTIQPDTLLGEDGEDVLHGGNEADELYGGAGHDTLDGEDGEDLLDGGEGDDTLLGHAQDDVLVGGQGADLLVGGDGNDTLDAWSLVDSDFAADTLDGGTGDDVYQVQDGADVILADPQGNDTVRALNTDWTLGAGLENLDLEDSVGSAYDGTGNELDNVIRSASEGGSLFGLGGDDLLVARHAQNTVKLFGGDGNDTLDGSGWSTEMDGGAGDDVLVGGGGLGSAMTGGAGADSFVFPAVSTAVISDFASATDKLRFDGATFDEIGASGNFAAGDARFFAGTAAHDADDRVIFDAATGNLWYDADGTGAAEQFLIAQVTGSVVATDIAVDNGTEPGGSAINGTAGDDSLVGTQQDDTINGLGGNDTIDGQDGGDRLDGGTGNDLLIGGRFDFEAEGGADTLIGGDGNDVLDARSSSFAHTDPNAETLDGGLGDDVYWVDNEDDVLLDAGGTDTVIAVNISYTLGAGFENLTLANDELEFTMLGVGNELDNVLGGAGFGWYVHYEGRGGDDSIFGSPKMDELYGGEGDDVIDGGSDFDTLDGGGGNDVLTGGEPNDFGNLYLFSVAPGVADADHITDFATALDTLQIDGAVHAGSGVSGRLAEDDARFWAAPGASGGHDADDRIVYNTTTGEVFWDADGSGAGAAQLFLTLNPGDALAASDFVIVNGDTQNVFTGTEGDDTLTGTSADDVLRGLGGDDVLDGLGGADVLDGGTGNDTYRVGEGDTTVDAGGIDEVVSGVSWTLGEGIENLTLTSGSLVGGTGNELDNVLRSVDSYRVGLSGLGGDDLLIGGGAVGAWGGYGDDVLDGGDGDDELRAGAGFDQLVGGSGNDRLFGEEENDNLYGGDGNDLLDGGAGGDQLSGGAGDDLYFVDAPGDAVIEAQNGGLDEVRSSLSSTTLSAWVNNLTLVGAAQNGTGNEIDNAIAGNDGANGLFGNAGNDVLQGLGGNDFLQGGDGADVVDGGLGSDTMSGNGGADRVAGGAGNDTLAGGSGQDFFAFGHAGAANADVVSDFASGWDHLLFDGAAFADSGPAGTLGANDGRFYAAAGASSGHDADDRFVFDTSTARLYYDADGSGAGEAQLVATLGNGATVAAGDITVL